MGQRILLTLQMFISLVFTWSLIASCNKSLASPIAQPLATQPVQQNEITTLTQEKPANTLEQVESEPTLTEQTEIEQEELETLPGAEEAAAIVKPVDNDAYTQNNLLFLIDSSTSIPNCKETEAIALRYEIPELFISFLATYVQEAKSSLYSPPVMNYSVYPQNNEDETINNDWVDEDWYSILENRLEHFENGVGYTAALSSTLDYYDESSDLTVVLITDGIIDYDNDNNKAQKRRNEIKSTLENLAAIEGIEVIVVQMPCANIVENDQNYWNFLAHPPNEEPLISLIRKNSLAEITNALLATPAMERVLPPRETKNVVWDFRSSNDEPFSQTTSPDDWFIWPYFVSPELTKQQDPYALTLNSPSDSYQFRPKGVFWGEESANGRIENSGRIDCNEPLKWEFNLHSNHNPNPPTAKEIVGFYIWKTQFPFDDIQIEFVEPPTIWNNSPITVTTFLFDNTIPGELLRDRLDNKCSPYSFSLSISMNGTIITKTSQSLNEVNSTHAWLIHFDKTPLTSGPQENVTISLQVTRNGNDSPIETALPEFIPAFFQPIPSGLEVSQPSNGYYLLEIDFMYLESRYYNNDQPPIRIFVATGKVGDNDILTDGFKQNCTVDETDLVVEHSFKLVDGPEPLLPTKAGLFQLADKHVKYSGNSLGIDIPQRWWSNKTKCGYQDLIIQWPALPGRANDYIVTCPLTTSGEFSCNPTTNYTIEEQPQP